MSGVVVSNTAVDKAGSRLREWLLRAQGTLDEYDPTPDFDLLTVWRSRFEAPMQASAVGLRSVVRTCQPDAPVRVSRRFKRAVQMINKLARIRTRLTQMEDVAGCRAVLPSSEVVRAVQERLGGARKMDVASVDDYTANPQRTGYRAVHLHAVRDGVKVEIQLRTTWQHLWAEQVEDWDETFGFDLKHGRGPDVMQDYFRLLASDYASRDARRQVPSSQRTALDRIRLQIRALTEKGAFR